MNLSFIKFFLANYGLIMFLLFFALVLRGQEIKILSYNIYHGEENYNRGHSNLNKIASVINKYKPDFVAMQEVDSMTERTAGFNKGVRKDLIAELAKLTDMHGYFGRAMTFDGGGYGEGLLTKDSCTSTVYHLPTPNGGEPRAMIAVYKQFENGKKMIFAGTHLCHEFEENRLAQAARVTEILANCNLPVAVAGDFNITPSSKPYSAMYKKLDDAAIRFGNPQLTFPFTKPKVRLDYVFINKGNIWKVKDVKVIEDENASDHLPLLVTLELINE